MLADTLKKIEECKQIIKNEPDPHDKTYNVKMGNIRKAKEDLETLFVEYKHGLKERLLLILVGGNSSNKFAEECVASKYAHRYDAMKFYQDLVDGIDESLINNCGYSPNMVDMINGQIELKAHELDIEQFNMLMYDHADSKTLLNKQDLINHIMGPFNKQIGVEFMALDILNQMAILATKDNYSETQMSVLPVVVNIGDNEKLAEEIATHFGKVTDQFFFVTAGVCSSKFTNGKAIAKAQKVTKESVKEVLKTIKGAMQ